MPAARGDGGAVVARSIAALIRDVPDFPEPGVGFKDISALLGDGAVFGACVGALAEHAATLGAQVIAGVEARGFLVAAAVARDLGAGILPVRKAGKLPPPTHRLSYDLEYGSAEIEVPRTDLAGRPVYLVDDVLATGGTLQAAATLLEHAGAQVVGIGLLVELEFLDGRARLTGRHLRSLLRL